MIIVQISDLHVRAPGTLAYGRVPTNDMLRAAIRQIGEMRPRPDAVIATGDLVHAGAIAEYEMLHHLLAGLGMPVYLVPGNHDIRENFAAVFTDHGYLPKRGFQHYVIDRHPVRLVGLDTVIPGSGGGTLCAERLAWLEDALAADRDRPTVVFMHHPPFRTGIDHMDVIGLASRDAFGAVIERHPQVERVLCGHLHRAIQVRWRGTLAATAPSTAHQVALDLRPGVDGVFALEPPGFQVHVWTPEVGVISHTVQVGNFDGPYPFVEPQETLELTTYAK